MRSNDKDIAFFARSPRGRDREGFLQKKGETNTAFKQRWFVLKGNLLFYFAAKTDQDPVGFILLENCRVSEARDEFCEFGISITFGTPSSRSYLLIAKDRDDMNGWVQAIHSASYSHMRDIIRLLRSEIDQLKRLHGGAASSSTAGSPATDEFLDSPKSSMENTSDRECDVPSSRPPRPRMFGQVVSSEDDDVDNDDDEDNNPGSPNVFQRTDSDAAAYLQSLEAPDDDDEESQVQNDTKLSTMTTRPKSTYLLPPSVPPPTAAISTPMTAPVFTSFAKEDYEPGSTLDVAFNAFVTRPVDHQKDSSDMIEFQIIVSKFDPMVRDWIVVGRTEVSPAMERTQQKQILYSADFLVSIQLHHVTQQQQYKLSLLRIEDIENDKIKPWGEALVTSFDIVRMKNTGTKPSVTLQIDTRWLELQDAAGHIVIRSADPVDPEDTQALGGFTTCPATRVRFEYQQQTYRLMTDTSRALKIRESIRESPWTFIVPILYLRFLEHEEQQLIRDLTGVPDSLPGNLDQIRKHQIKLHCHLVSGLQSALSNFESYSGKSFRPSTSKKGEDMQFIALNCHIQNLVVCDGHQSHNIMYDFVTFGAACAHGYGFKKGGLKSLLENLAAIITRDALDDDNKAVNTPVESMKEQRSSSVINVMKSVSRMAGFMRETSSTSTAPQQVHVPSLFFDGATGTNLSASSLQAAEPVKPRSVLPRTQNSWRSQRQHAVDVMTSFTRLVDETKSAARIPEKAERLPALDRARSQLYTVVHFLLSQANSAGSTTEEATAIANKISQSSWPTLYSAVQSAADGAMGPSAIESLNTALDALIRNIERLSLLIMTELHVNFVKEDAAALSHLSLRLRLAAVQSQALTALVSIFASNLSNHIDDMPFLLQLMSAGYLAHFESLLSTSGDENGMLEDMYVAVRELSTVRIRLEPVEASSDPKTTARVIDFQGKLDAIIIVFFLPLESFSRLPPELQNGKLIDVCPIIFTQGINEMQTVANAVGDTTLQDSINAQSYALLRAYMKSYRTWIRDCKLLTARFVELRLKQLDDCYRELQAAITNSKRSKNPQILLLSERLTRLMNGGRLTSCKSAKDRTSMAVTLEQVLLLKTSHRLINDQFDTARDAMRSQGVRIQNAKKNTGTARYAFNYFQSMTLPKLYRPPRGTGGGGAA